MLTLIIYDLIAFVKPAHRHSAKFFTQKWLYISDAKLFIEFTIYLYFFNELLLKKRTKTLPASQFNYSDYVGVRSRVRDDACVRDVRVRHRRFLRSYHVPE